MTAKTFSPKRGRPSAKQAAAIDDAILATARRLFLSEGFDALAMDAVAAELGVSKGTLYARHPSKEALLHAVLRDTIASWSVTSAKSNHSLPKELKARLQAHLRSIGQTMIGPEVRAYYRLWASVQHRVPEVASLFYEVGFLQGVNIIAQDIKADATQHNIEAKNPVSVANLIMSTFTGWYAQESSVREVTADELNEVADRTVELFYLGRTAW